MGKDAAPVQPARNTVPMQHGAVPMPATAGATGLGDGGGRPPAAAAADPGSGRPRRRYEDVGRPGFDGVVCVHYAHE
eukprot:gene16754-6304_t